MTVDLLLDTDGWSNSSQAARREAMRALADSLGSSWSLARDDERLIEHEPSQMRFVAIPGGTFSMGCNVEDLERIRPYVEEEARRSALFSRAYQQGFRPRSPRTLATDLDAWVTSTLTPGQVEEACHGAVPDEIFEEDTASFLAASSPVRQVKVAPFLCARQLAAIGMSEGRITGERAANEDPALVSRASALRLAEEAGVRLCSEAELEWLACEGDSNQRFVLGLDLEDWFACRQTSCMGVADLFWGQWASDTWHPTHAGALGTSQPPRSRGSAVGVIRWGTPPTFIQTAEDLKWVLCGARTRGDEVPGMRAGLRLAASFPAFQ